jgi:hypothetical protein
MDASSSAYQLMSFMLFHVELAVQTNLIKWTKSRHKHDLYTTLLEELSSAIHKEFDPGYQVSSLVIL